MTRDKTFSPTFLPVSDLEAHTTKSFLFYTMQGLQACAMDVRLSGAVKTEKGFEVTGQTRRLYPSEESIIDVVGRGYQYYFITGSYTQKLLDYRERLTRGELMFEMQTILERLYSSIATKARYETFGEELLITMTTLSNLYDVRELIDFTNLLETECQSLNTDVKMNT